MSDNLKAETVVARSAFSIARSFLFVPANRPERYLKAFASGSDVVVFDLEDAVAPETKNEARTMLCSKWAELTEDQRARTVIRINDSMTPWHGLDIDLVKDLSRIGLAALMLPKTAGAVEVNLVHKCVRTVAIFPLIETAAGFGALEEIASANGVARLCFGSIDLQAELGITAQRGVENELAPARWALVTASRRAGLAAPIDGVTTDLADHDLLREDVRRGVRFGFTGKLCIHPAQIEGVHAAMMPTPEETEWARAVLAAVEQSNGHAIKLNGKMIDAPVVLQAHQIMARCSA